MNFHHNSVAATVPLGSLRCQAGGLTRSFRQSPIKNRSRHPDQYQWRLSFTARFISSSGIRSEAGVVIWRKRDPTSSHHSKPPLGSSPDYVGQASRRYRLPITE
jgi:hypothetical protein